MTATPERIKEMKAWIDKQPLDTLLYKWRHTPLGDPYFCNKEVGEYFGKRMQALREADPDEWVAASKRVGWEK